MSRWRGAEGVQLSAHRARAWTSFNVFLLSRLPTEASFRRDRCALSRCMRILPIKTHREGKVRWVAVAVAVAVGWWWRLWEEGRKGEWGGRGGVWWREEGGGGRMGWDRIGSEQKDGRTTEGREGEEEVGVCVGVGGRVVCGVWCRCVVWWRGRRKVGQILGLGEGRGGRRNFGGQGVDPLGEVCNVFVFLFFVGREVQTWPENDHGPCFSLTLVGVTSMFLGEDVFQAEIVF